ncbi:MAG: hypothetical protein JNL02_13655 [Saprospiraceae bacterium]|nr:hypothetical protein [Saprospiraceae bacterium]
MKRCGKCAEHFSVLQILFIEKQKIFYFKQKCLLAFSKLPARRGESVSREGRKVFIARRDAEGSVFHAKRAKEQSVQRRLWIHVKGASFIARRDAEGSVFHAKRAKEQSAQRRLWFHAKGASFIARRDAEGSVFHAKRAKEQSAQR